jgi:hypothetical protein
MLPFGSMFRSDVRRATRHRSAKKLATWRLNAIAVCYSSQALIMSAFAIFAEDPQLPTVLLALLLQVTT